MMHTDNKFIKNITLIDKSWKVLLLNLFDNSTLKLNTKKKDKYIDLQTC